MTIAELQAYVGCPRSVGETHHTMRDELMHTSWQDAMGELAGWWWAITSGDVVIAMGFTVGDRDARDRELALAHDVARVLWAAIRPRDVDNLELN